MQQPMPSQQHPAAMPVVGNKRKLSPMQLVAGLLVFAVAVLAVLVLVYMVIGGPKSLDDAVKKSQYQAVFLNSQDGQVYFGKLASYNGQYYKLTDIYYVRVENKLQPDQNTNTNTQQSISLAKLGNELHGPEDEMYIAKDKVLFWENLKNDGQVVKAIVEYKKNPDAAKSSSSSTSSSSSSTDSTSSTTSNTSTTTKK